MISAINNQATTQVASVNQDAQTQVNNQALLAATALAQVVQDSLNSIDESRVSSQSQEANRVSIELNGNHS